MRAYFFGNMYLSQIQQGIQAAHVVSEMFVNYPSGSHPRSGPTKYLWDWAEDHKTMILLNGGYGENLHDLMEFFDRGVHAYPYAKFHESKGALDNAITSVGIILPDTIYEGAKEMRRVKRLRRDDESRWAFEEHGILTLCLERDEFSEEYKYSGFEIELMERINTFRLA